MKGAAILLQTHGGKTHAAWIVNGQVTDLLIDPPLVDLGDGPTSEQRPEMPVPGAIYRGKVTSKSSAIGTFVDLGHGQSAFLRSRTKHRPGTWINVQIETYAETGKAAPASDRLLFKGQLTILTPSAPGVNVSRAIKALEERERLQSVIDAAKQDLQADRDLGPVLHDAGVIVRTAAAGAEPNWLAADLLRVARMGTEVLHAGEMPGLLSQRHHALSVATTDWLQPAPGQICVASQDEDLFQAIQTRVTNPEWRARIDRSMRDPFDHFGVWDQIAELKNARVDLPSGGWMAIEPTRAMVTIDVNTGAQFSDGAGMSASIEAARAMPRELRLRGLGGQITVDFAPIKKMHRKKIEETLKSAFRKDTVSTTLAGWTPLGNFELQRKRDRRPLVQSCK